MRSTVLLIILLLVLNAAWASKEHYYDKPRAIKNISSPTVVKLSRASSKHYYVLVKINDQGPFKFMLDTGASLSVISQKVVDSLKLQQSIKGKYTRNNKEYKANLYRIPKLSLGHAELYDYDMIVYPEPTFMSYLKNEFNEQIDGVLGIGAFYYYLLTLDFPNKIISLGNEQLELSTKNIIAFNNNEKIPIVSVSFKDKGNHSKKMDFVLDTGSNEEFTLPPLVKSLAFKKISSEKIQNGTHYGEYSALKEKIIANGYWGNKVFKNPTVVYNQSIYDTIVPFGLMGILALEKCRITIDQKKSLLKLE
jgi:predicted aspartyl protease